MGGPDAPDQRDCVLCLAGHVLLHGIVVFFLHAIVLVIVALQWGGGKGEGGGGGLERGS